MFRKSPDGSCCFVRPLPVFYMSRLGVRIMAEVPDIDKLELSRKILSPTIKMLGGDRDGHPGVTSAVTIQTLLLHKRLCLRKYIEAVRALIRDLSSSLNQVPITEDLKRSLEEDSRVLSDFAGQTDQLNRYEPYRRKLDFMRVKLENTLEEVEKTAVEFGLGQTLINFKKMIPPESVAKPPLYARSRELLSTLDKNFSAISAP